MTTTSTRSRTTCVLNVSWMSKDKPTAEKVIEIADELYIIVRKLTDNPQVAMGAAVALLLVMMDKHSKEGHRDATYLHTIKLIEKVWHDPDANIVSELGGTGTETVN